MPKKPHFAPGEVLENGTMTPLWVKNHLSHLIKERNADPVDVTLRIDGFFGTGLHRRAQERTEARTAKLVKAFEARIAEFQAAGVDPTNARPILLAEGWKC